MPTQRTTSTLSDSFEVLLLMAGLSENQPRSVSVSQRCMNRSKFASADLHECLLKRSQTTMQNSIQWE